jgi:hypothetical protein
MTAAIVIVFLLNGTQVSLPAPALMLENTAYVPARAVYEKLGWQVEWNGQQRRMRVSVPGACAYTFAVDDPTVTLECSVCPTTPDGTRRTLEAAPRLVGDCFYVPVRAVTLMTDSHADWEGATLTVNLITSAQGDAVAADIGAIVADPPKWTGQRVRLHGEYTGAQVEALGAAVTHGPPTTNNDWTVRDATGSLYCTLAAELPVKLDPINDLGRRLEVVGNVALKAGGWPYLRVGTITLLTGLDGITCYLTTDRNTYQPGDTIRMRMQVRNPTAAPLVLNFNSGQQYDFTVTDPEGKTLWKWSRGMMFTQALTAKTLKPGEAYLVTAEYVLPATLPPAHYKVSGLLNREVRSYVKPVAVGAE